MNYRIKVRLFLGILFSCFFGCINAQSTLLEEGDILFDQQKYTEAYERYEKLYLDKKASQAMILKMAFIKDGLGDYTEALFFLDKYYQMSADRNVVSKIEELAEANGLIGYTYDDTNYFSAILGKYRTALILLILATMGLLLAYIFKKTKEDERPIAAGIIQLIIIVGLFVLINFKASPQAILLSDNTLLRTGPSAGAEPIEMLSKGHKVKVLSQDEVWTQIVWDGREAYVRNGKLRVI